MNITEQLNENVMKEWRFEPNIEENNELVLSFIKKLKCLFYKNHFLQKEGICTLLNMLKDTNLKYIPISVLRNKLSPLETYISTITTFEEEGFFENNEEEVINILTNILVSSYTLTLENINYFLNLKDEEN